MSKAKVESREHYRSKHKCVNFAIKEALLYIKEFIQRIQLKNKFKKVHLRLKLPGN